MSNPRSTGVRTALVLAGGGARAAYEVGVLKYIFENMHQEGLREVKFDIFSGTSAGAINCCALACQNQDPSKAAANLVKLWSELTLQEVIQLGVKNFSSLSGLIFGKRTKDSYPHPPSLRPKASLHQPVAGILENRPLMDKLARTISWTDLQNNLASGCVTGIALCSTEVCTGRPVVFYQPGGGAKYMPGRDALKQERQVEVGLDHVMASASFPFLFPAYQIEGVCYTDGGLRQNTPINPAMRFKADRMLVVSLGCDMRTEHTQARIGCRLNPYPGIWFMLERMLSALLTDTLDDELRRLEMFNQLIQVGLDQYGQAYVDDINQVSMQHRNANWRIIRTCLVRPCQNLDDLAVEVLEEKPDEMTLSGWQGRLLKRLLSASALVSSGFLSRIMFTPTYISRLISLGYKDAEKRRDELGAFFGV